MKRFFATLVAAVIAAGSLCACSKAPEKNSSLSIVTTIFPEYDWVMNVLGDNNYLTLRNAVLLDLPSK